MPMVLMLLLSTLSVLIEVLQWMMLARAIISWIPALENSRISDFLYIVTDWVIAPVRALFDAFGGGKSMLPIDIPFFITYILLSVIGMMI